MAETIASVPVLTHDEDMFLSRWGTTVYDYELNTVPTDFQDLMVAISEQRATAVEGEVTPLSTRMRQRNHDLEQLGSLLAIFTQTQAKFDNEATGDSMAKVDGVTEEMLPMANEAYRRKGSGEGSNSVGWWNSDTWTKKSVDAMVSILKSMIDERNNAAQTDMTRLQSLVDRRDESFNTATTLMTSISDTRSNAIRNM